MHTPLLTAVVPGAAVCAIAQNHVVRSSSCTAAGAATPGVGTVSIKEQVRHRRGNGLENRCAPRRRPECDCLCRGLVKCAERSNDALSRQPFSGAPPFHDALRSMYSTASCINRSPPAMPTVANATVCSPRDCASHPQALGNSAAPTMAALT